MSDQVNDEELVTVKNPLNLPTYQRRLRHLHGIAVRNLQLSKNQNVDFSKLQVYFTLHKSSKEKALYTSEKVRGSLNPTWQSFDLQTCDQDLDLTAKYVIVRIWMSHGQASKVKIEANVYLSGLLFFSDKLQVESVNHQPNTLLFGMLGGFFINYNAAVPNSKLADWLPDKAVPREKLPVSAIVDQSTLKQSYNTNSLSRIHTVQRAIKQTQASVRRIHSQLEDKLLSSNENSEKLCEREVLVMKVRQLRHELLWQTQKKQSEQEVLESFKAQQDAKLNDLKQKRLLLQNLCKGTEENRTMHIQSREMLVKENAQVLFRRKQIISEMVQLIYPITEDERQNFYISKVKLPNAENYQGQDETRLSIALGFTCHLVLMLSQFMDMPLRYPMVHRGSRSIILDHIHSRLTEKDREFPLYGKGKEKFQYNYAVFLLNKNISQLRFFCGLGTNDLRETLPNLKTLFEQRLGARSNEVPPDAAGRQVPAQPDSASPSRNGLDPSSRHSGSSVAAGQGHRASGWANSDFVPSGRSSLVSGSSGGHSSSCGVVEGIGLTSFNGSGVAGSAGREGSKVIVKPLLPDQRPEGDHSNNSQQNGASNGHHVDNGREFEGFLQNGGLASSVVKGGVGHDQRTIEEESDETEGEELFEPAGDDTFFQVARKQALDDIHTVLDASENDAALLPSVREQVLRNGGMDPLPVMSASSDAESRTFKLVKCQAEEPVSPVSPDEVEVTPAINSVSSSTGSSSLPSPSNSSSSAGGQGERVASPAASPQSELSPLEAGDEAR